MNVPKTVIEDTPLQEEAEPAEDIVDPEDPLYGLEQRLRGLGMDDE